MLRIHEIKLNLDEDVSVIPIKIAKKLGIMKEKVKRVKIHKESIDARNKSDIKKVYSVDFLVDNEEAALKRSKSAKVEKRPDEVYKYVFLGQKELRNRPIIIGFGPCGMFAALILSQMGFRPLVLERGKSVEERILDVERFWECGVLDEESNVQFGEGGAGTFSDGKLNTGVKELLIRKVLEEFVEAGADENILYKQKPHIGTDVLRKVVKNMRTRIENLGGEIRFQSKVTDINIQNGKIEELIVNYEERIRADAVILAVGHSARDTFAMLKERNVAMESKPFSIGLRIEHPQAVIDESQLGDKNLAEITGAAEYKLSYRCKNGRGVYSFCMCPGGSVVASASENGRLTTNGMSYSKRDGENANSGLMVGVDSADFESDNCLAGIEFQRKWEEAAFVLGGSNFHAPAQLIGDFLRNVPSSPESIMKKESFVEATYKPGVTWTNLSECLPEFAVSALREALPNLGRKLNGFDMENAVLTGVETRSSSPIRIKRNEGYLCNIEGIYPAGEGAGYAGGITSSAIDGIKVAEKIASTFSNIAFQ